jgi:glutathione S-transferase
LLGLPRMQFVDVDTARSARGLRLVVMGGVPSLWSEAAKGILRLKAIPFLAVRYTVGDQQVPQWTGIANAPVAINDDEPPRSQWHEILALAERLEPRTPLVPAAAPARAMMFGLSHEICSERGLAWCARLQLVHLSLSSGGARGFPTRVAQHLAARYGYAAELMPWARRRVSESLSFLSEQLARSRHQGHEYFLGPRPTALDVYAATALAPLAPLPPEQCPMHPRLRKAFDDLAAELQSPLPDNLLAHRQLMYERHLGLPLEV